MKCYNHSEAEAVGICKSCGKGLCHACLTDVGGGIACKTTCAESVTAMNQLVQRNINASKNYGSTLSITVIFLIGLGLIFITWGFFTTAPMLRWFNFPVGILFIALGVYNIWLSRRILRDKARR